MPTTRPDPPAEPGLYCKHCGYDLRGNESCFCPECGTWFFPKDPRTFSSRPPRERLRKWIKRGLVTLLIGTLALGGSWGWLYWGWWEEQQTLTILNGAFSAKYVFIGPDWLTKLLGPAGFVLYRVNFMGMPDDGILIGAHPRPLTQNHTNTDLARLADFKWLERLSLDSALITDLTPLARLTKLSSLNIMNSSVSDLSPLSQLSGLRHLCIQNSPVQDLSPLSHLTELKELILVCTSVSNLSALTNLTGLRKLTIVEPNITEPQAQDLQQVLPKCDISRIQITVK